MATKTFERAARAHASSRASLGTRLLYLAELERWLAWCRRHRFNPAKPTLVAATKFRDELTERFAKLTVRRILASLSSMYQAAIDQERPLATWNPFKSLPRPPAEAVARTEAISEDKARTIIGVTEQDSSSAGLRDTAILRLLYDVGLRRASVASIHSSRLFLRAEETVLRVTVKGNKEREVVLPSLTASALGRWLMDTRPSEGFVFPSSGKGGNHRARCAKPITPSAINKIIERRAKAAGIQGVHPHQFRAAFATTALDAGAPLHEVQAAMHHEDPKTTLLYDRGRRGAKVTATVAAYRGKGTK